MKEETHGKRKKTKTIKGKEQSFPITLAFGPNANSSVAHIKNGRIVRIRPLHYDWKFDSGCAHFLDSGEWEVPRCVNACPTGAIKFGDEEDFEDLIAKAEVLNPEKGAKPRCYYLNIRKKFIAGTVYDPIEKEVIIGATCTLTGPKTRGKTTTTTDGFGDFWLQNLEDGVSIL